MLNFRIFGGFAVKTSPFFLGRLCRGSDLPRYEPRRCRNIPADFFGSPPSARKAFSGQSFGAGGGSADWRLRACVARGNFPRGRNNPENS
jgi:hypothetical protein